MIQKLGLQLQWQPSSLAGFLPLGANELHIWHLKLCLDESQTNTALQLLSDNQRDKYHRRSSPYLQQQYLAGRYYLLTLLGGYTNQAPEEVLLSYSRLNKPSLSDENLGVEFNFTDTDGQGMFAFSQKRQVGVDIECLDRDIDFSAIAKRRFTEQELAFAMPDNQIDHQRCLAIWTRKEAYGKATGKGINFTMNQRNLYKGGAESHVYRFTDDQDLAWTCRQLSVGKKYIASVAHAGHEHLTIKAFDRLREPLI